MSWPYGIKIIAYREGSDSGAHFIREFQARGRTEAATSARGWLMVEGYDVTRSVVEVIADGVTFADHMKQELVNMAGRLSLRYGVSMQGPFAWKDGNGDPRAAVRLWMPNGRGVSVASKVPEECPIQSEYGAIREDADDPNGWVFDKTAQHYSERTTVGEGFDGDVSALLERIKSLPRK